MRRGPKPKTLVERVLTNIEVNDDGCWLWQRRINRYGYGQIEITRRPERSSPTAHRVAYELWNGPVPEGLGIDHTCHTDDLSCLGGTTCLHRRCCNPDHLEAVTQGENVRRGRGVKRAA